MDNFVPKEVYNEHMKRIDDENTRQNKRIELLENSTQQIMDIAASVRELAVSIKQMAETQEKQGKRLEKLEEKDGVMWRQVVGYAITVVVGIVLGFMFKRIGM